MTEFSIEVIDRINNSSKTYKIDGPMIDNLPYDMLDELLANLGITEYNNIGEKLLIRLTQVLLDGNTSPEAGIFIVECLAMVVEEKRKENPNITKLTVDVDGTDSVFVSYTTTTKYNIESKKGKSKMRVLRK